MSIKQELNEDWKEEFRKQFNGQMCDGFGNGNYYELEPALFDFITQELKSAFERGREAERKEILTKLKKWKVRGWSG